jgi:hypothetical protein
MKTSATNLFWMAVGAGLAFLYLQPGFAREQTPQVSLPNSTLKCSAKVGPARFTVGDRCFRDEVMVGRWDDNIYCANIEIVCE